jgi:multidrug efflux pump
MSRFFIDRPIFAWVIAIADHGVRRSVDPGIADRPISKHCADVDIHHGELSRRVGSTVVSTVTQVIEEQMKGIDKLSYLSSTSDSKTGS